MIAGGPFERAKDPRSSRTDWRPGAIPRSAIKIGVLDRQEVYATFHNAMLYSRKFRPTQPMAVALPSGRGQDLIRRDGLLDKITRRTQC